MEIICQTVLHGTWEKAALQVAVAWSPQGSGVARGGGQGGHGPPQTFGVCFFSGINFGQSRGDPEM